MSVAIQNKALQYKLGLAVMGRLGLSCQVFETSTSESPTGTFQSEFVDAQVTAIRFDSGVFFLLNFDAALDATTLLVVAVRECVKKVVVLVLIRDAYDTSIESLAYQRATRLANVIYNQLSNASFELEIYVASRLDNIEKFQFMSQVLLVSPRGDSSFSCVPDKFQTDLRWRFGNLYLEHLGIPYAKIDQNLNIMQAGVSEAEAEYLSMTAIGSDIENVLGKIKVEIASKRMESKFGPIARSLKSRWLAGMLGAEPELIAAQEVVEVDVFRPSYVGIDPFSNLILDKGGFWGSKGDYCDFIQVAHLDGSTILFGVCVSIDLACVTKTLEVVNMCKANVPDLQMGLVVTAPLMKISAFKEILASIGVRIRIMLANEDLHNGLSLEVVTNGL